MLVRTDNGINMSNQIKSQTILAEDCFKCGGEGRILTWSHVDNGVCFQCQGTGHQFVGEGFDLSDKERANARALAGLRWLWKRLANGQPKPWDTVWVSKALRKVSDSTVRANARASLRLLGIEFVRIPMPPKQRQAKTAR
jgi:hypothetical protein